MTQTKDQMRIDFESWAKANSFNRLTRCPLDQEKYSQTKMQWMWEAWQAARTIASKQSDPPTHAMFKRVFRHGVVRDWQECSVEYANYILSNPERFGDTEVKFLKEV